MEKYEVFIFVIVIFVVIAMIWFEWRSRKKIYPTSAIKWLVKELKSLGEGK